MRKLFFFKFFLISYFLLIGNVYATLISEMPAYDWYHGCGPTAAASIFGHYDLNGYDSLFAASGWDEVKYTSNVQDEISSPEHNEKYDPTPDRDDIPDPPDTSIADFFILQKTR